MERIIRLNAVEILCLSGILGMNQHSLHPVEHLAPQKLTISRVSLFFALLIKALLNTLNTKLGNTLLGFKAAIGNTQFLRALLLALLNSISFTMIFAIATRVRKIEQVTHFFKETRLWVVKTREKIRPEVFLREQIKARDKKAFYGKPAVSLANLPYWLLSIFNKQDKVLIKLVILGNPDYDYMLEKVVSNYEDTRTSEKLSGACQIKLLLEGKK